LASRPFVVPTNISRPSQSSREKLCREPHVLPFSPNFRSQFPLFFAFSGTLDR
jgi:hypothetical protein